MIVVVFLGENGDGGLGKVGEDVDGQPFRCLPSEDEHNDAEREDEGALGEGEVDKVGEHGEMKFEI